MSDPLQAYERDLRRQLMLLFSWKGSRAGIERIVTEVRAHLDDTVRELCADGSSNDEATRRALDLVGSARVVARAYESQSVPEFLGAEARGRGEPQSPRDWRAFLGTWLHDLRFVVRSLARSPGYAIAFVLTLGLGIGANTAIFSVVNGVLLSPLPHRDGSRLVYIRQSAPLINVANVLFSVPEIADYRSQAETLDGVAEFSAMTFTMHGFDEPLRLRAGIVTGNYFSVMGLRPVLGRTFGPEADGESAAPRAVLTVEYWQSRFGGDRDVIGRHVTMNGRSLEIVGVLEQHPPYPESTDVYVNMAASPHHLSASMNHDRLHRMTEIFARTAPGITVEEVASEVRGIAGSLHQEYVEAYDPTFGYTISAVTLRDQLTRRARPTLLVLLGATALVLIIACANVANLSLTRMMQRSHDLAVRASLGASPGRLRRFLLSENLLLSLLGAGLGLVIAYLGLDALVAYAARFTSRASEVRFEGEVFALAFAVAAVASLLFAWVPRLPGAASAGITGMSASRATTGRGGRRLQAGLVVSQVAASFVLLIVAALLGRTLMNLQSVDPGFELGGLLTMDIPTPFDDTSRTPVELKTLFTAIVEQTEALPGVETAGLTSGVPLRRGSSGFSPTIEMRIEGYEPEPGAPAPRGDFMSVTPGYFDMIGTPIVAGRDFASTDVADGPLVVVINASMAEYYFGEADVVGRRIAWSGDAIRFLGADPGWRTIVGVVADTRARGLDQDVPHSVYQPFEQASFFARSLVVRTAGEPTAFVRPIIEIVRGLAPDLPIVNIGTLEEVRRETVAPQRLNAALVGAFALLAVTIAAVGVTGVLAVSVSQRTREFGIRTALGADSARVLRDVLSEGAILAVVGLAIGAVLALISAGSLSGLLFGVRPVDPATYAAAAVILTMIALGAAWVPAWRAAHVDPVRALRGD